MKHIATTEDAIELIMRSIVLVRKAVVQVDFGYNVGTEFGGRHPAIILKNLKDSLIVIPYTSIMPLNDFQFFLEYQNHQTAALVYIPCFQRLPYIPIHLRLPASNPLCIALH